MTKTCKSYIEEYNIFDSVFESLNDVSKDVNIAIAQYDMKMHQFRSKMFFESSQIDYDALMESEGENVLSRIGNAVLKLIQKVTDFISKITNKINDNIKYSKSDEEKVNQIITQHPELRNQVIDGIDKNWFTVSDVAKFEKDVIGLINMLNKNAIDHQTFMDKFRASCKKFAESNAPILAATTTVIGFMKIVPEIHKQVRGVKNAINSFNEAGKKFKNDIDNNYSKDDITKANAIMYALKQAIGLTTSECKHQVESQNKVRNVFRWIARKITFDTPESKDAAKNRVKTKEEEKVARDAAKKNAKKAHKSRDDYDAQIQRGQTSLFDN